MGKILFGIIAAVASFMLVESLTCNKCSYGLLGFCISSSELTCAANETCFTGKATFKSLSSVGFNTQGCRMTDGCNMTSSPNMTILGISYETKIDCCSTDKCNPTVVSGTPANKMTLTAAVGAAVLASVWGSML